MPARNKADPDPDWDRNKAKIEFLYVEDGLKLEGTGGLMDTMAKDYGFSKKKSQYETHFKIWGTRKYRTKDEWNSIGRNIAERKRAGKESAVCINGKPIPNSRVQKQIRRHTFATALERILPAPIPPIPDGFEIQTPAADDIAPSTAIPDDTPSSPIGMETRICGSSQLQIVSSALPSQTVTSDASLPVLWNIISSSPSTTPTDPSPLRCQNAIFSPPRVPGTYGSPVSLYEDLYEDFQRLYYVSGLPFYQFDDFLRAQLEPSLMSKIEQIPGSEPTLEISLLPEHPYDVFHEHVNVLYKMLKGPETLSAVFKALLPSEDDQMILRSNYSRSDSASSQIFSLLIFAMANNFAGLYTEPIEEIMDFLSRHASSRLLQHILSASGPESEAFAEKLFEAAILKEQAHIVKILLQNGLVPNDLICVYRGERYTPLEYSCMVWNVEITRLLLDANLDVKKSFVRSSGLGGARDCAFTGPYLRGEQASGPIPFELVHMLLETGCNFPLAQLNSEFLQCDSEVTNLVLDNLFKTKTYDQAWGEFVQSMNNCDNATATKIYTKFLKAGATIDHSVIALGGEPDFPIDIAAERGNLELVQLLLRSCVSSTRKTLACAIRSKSKELTRFLLDYGADFFALDESATEHWYDVEKRASRARSPLAEAIHWGEPEILDLLEKKGAWSLITNKVTIRGEFEDVLIAASVRGNLEIVQKLLQYRPPNTHGRDLSDALVAAIYVNEEAIVSTLLDAGADVNDGYYLSSDIDTAGNEWFDGASCYREGNRCRGPALVEALLQKNEHLVRLILDADVHFDHHRVSDSPRPGSQWTPLEAAVEWGNLSIIEEVISIGLFNEWNALVISVRRKDLECTQLLINAGVAVSSEALSTAVTNNDIKMFEYLFSVGAYPAIPDALYEIEALSSRLPMIERLLTEFSRHYPHGRPHEGLEYNNGLFSKAIQEGNLALIELLLKAKIAVNFDIEMSKFHFQDPSLSCSRITLFGAAITQRHKASLEIFQRLLSELRNPNVIVQTYKGIAYDTRETALLAAIDRKDRQKVQLLIAAGADVNWPATKGIKRTPLQKSAEVGSYEITQLLIDHGGLLNNEPAVRGGATALQLAAIGGYIGIALLLLEKGADVNAPAAKFYGRTALEGAAEYGRVDMLKLLWNAGAKFQGTEYEKARELAKENGHMATWRYLESLYRPSEEISMDT